MVDLLTNLTYFFYFLQGVVDILTYRLLYSPTYFLPSYLLTYLLLYYFLQGVVDTAQDGECSSKDSATQWMDCGIPCPVGEEVTLLLVTLPLATRYSLLATHYYSLPTACCLLPTATTYLPHAAYYNSLPTTHHYLPLRRA